MNGVQIASKLHQSNIRLVIFPIHSVS